MIVINLLSEIFILKTPVGSRYFISLLLLEVNVKSMNVQFFIEEFI